MNICFVSYDYPDERRSVFPFVKQLVDEIARQGHTCQVVAPYSITRSKKSHKFKERINIGAGEVIIYRPNYISFSNIKICGISITNILHQAAVNYALRHIERKPDVVYGHFWKSGFEAYPYAKKHNIPLFVATGESSIRALFNCKPENKEYYEYVSKVICVSTKNKEESIKLGLTCEEKCVVIPNAIDSNKFKKLNKKKCRAAIGIFDDEFVVSFVGGFIERKGVLRLSEAIDEIKGRNIKSIFIGGGEQNPCCKNIIFKGRLLHEEIPAYLNASDIFVLPTQAEGCCNAIIEAMACGLPVVSSNLPFNWDILNSRNSIMINPNDITEISNAIIKLYDSPILRENMSEEALKTAEFLNIENRAKIILKTIEK